MTPSIPAYPVTSESNFRNTVVYWLQQICTQLAASSSGELVWVPTPANDTDFSVLPGAAIPAGNQVYLANRDANTLWVISAADAKWKIINKSSLS
jgi:hypothetical protein